METTRRNFIRTAAGVGVAGLLLPSWLFPRETRTAAIDFSLFCNDYTSPKYDMTRPFLQNGSVYATDGRHGIRVGKNVIADLAGEEARLPAAERLPWADADSSGWLPYSSLHRVKRHSHDYPACPTCDGKGRVGVGVVSCIGCLCVDDMSGDEIERWARGEWPECECEDRGYVGGNACDECNGSGSVDYVYSIGSHKVAPTFVRRHMTLPGCEFRVGDEIPTTYVDGRIVQFPGGVHTRFEGGVGMIAGLAR